MKRISIRGLVAFAGQVRRQVAGPMTPQGKTQLRQQIEHNRRVVEDLLRSHGLDARALPPPTRRALQFLTQVNLEAVAVCEHAVESPPAATVRFTRLASAFEAILDVLGHPAPADPRGRVHAAIVAEHRHLKRQMDHHRLEPSALCDEHRLIYGWLALFAEPEWFGALTAALEAARPCIEDAARRAFRRPVTLILHFRPMRGVFRWRGRDDVHTLKLPAPMISFDAPGFQAVARLIFDKGRRDGAVIECMQAPQYRRIAALLDVAGDSASRARGRFHDLAASFDRVNAAYFGGTMPAPRLRWGERFTSCTFGHYDFGADEVQISASLDAAHVPPFVVDSVMYHELLHKRTGLRFSDGKAHAHTPEFRSAERRFARYDEADLFLKRLARGVPQEPCTSPGAADPRGSGG